MEVDEKGRVEIPQTGFGSPKIASNFGALLTSYTARSVEKNALFAGFSAVRLLFIFIKIKIVIKLSILHVLYICAYGSRV